MTQTTPLASGGAEEPSGPPEHGGLHLIDTDKSTKDAARLAEAVRVAMGREDRTVHCRTQAHVARLFDVPAADLRRLVKQTRDDALRQAAMHQRTGALPGGRAEALYATSRGTQDEALQQLRERAREFEEILPRRSRQRSTTGKA